MFDRYVTAKRPSWKRRAVLIGSLGLHGALAVGLLVASLFTVAEIAPPLLSVVFMATAEPPPPASLPARKRAAGKHAAKTPTARPLLPPTPATPTAARPRDDAPAEVAPDDGSGEADSSDEGTGSGNGVVGGLGRAGTTVATPAPRPRNVGPHQLDAQRIAGSDPHLPELVKAQRRGLGDSAFVARICVDQAGAVSAISVLQGIPGADGAIVAALRGWRYRPQALPVCFVSRFVFDVQ